jgi:hypothetical protein
MRPWKLTNPDHPIVKRALQKRCPSCQAEPGDRCVTNNIMSKGRHFSRIVHYARVEFHQDA